ncbi:helix-turn-helix transcriptional regulator [candidate division WWE3 bacterium]|uniref:Helix-turn-helix transcriptional regulator n=1 Tax=candidate division WWE3 bacterium TaxID=2053526 RepID=A0A7X9E6G7_UNCKA|nr:helix-turn-helix transcriptional regulator [candidate division WWE3 bacterium]
MEKNLGKKIKDIREKNNLSQERFGRKIGKSGKTISAYEKGRCTPSLKVLDLISQTYDVSFVHLKDSRGTQLWEKIQGVKNVLEEIESMISHNKDTLR